MKNGENQCNLTGMKRNTCPVDLFMQAPMSHRLSYNYDLDVNPIYYEEDLLDRELLHRLDADEPEDLSVWNNQIARLIGRPYHGFDPSCMCMSCLNEWYHALNG